MPKQKTNKSASKRFKITKNGKVLRRHAGSRHLLSSKSGKRKRYAGKANVVNPADMANVMGMLLNG